MRGDNSCPTLTRAMIDKMPKELQRAFWRTEHVQTARALRIAFSKAIKECPNHNLPDFVVRFAKGSEKQRKVKHD